MILDQRIAQSSFCFAQDYPEHLRRIRFKNPESGKSLIFMINNATPPPLIISDAPPLPLAGKTVLQVANQHWRIKRPPGASENAVRRKSGAPSSPKC